MISASTISNSGKTSNYFLTEAKNEQEIAKERAGSGTNGEYYLNEQAPSVWNGAGAAMQGLDGQAVTKENLQEMLNGKVTEIDKDGHLADRQLGRTVTDEQTGEKSIDHKSGWDFTFSAPKSVSIEAEVFGNNDVKQSHEEAVQATMNWLESNGAGTRMGPRKEFQQTGNLTWASFSHSTTREKDPQTHTHCLIQNLTYDQDGKAYSLESKGIYQLRALADRIYKNELASNLKANGLAVEFDKKGNFEISGYSQEQLNVFSKRTDQIDSYLEKQGINPEKASAEQRQIATLATRPKKDFEESREAHYQKWEKEAAEHGITPATRSAEPQTRQSASEVLNNAISSLTERESAFTTKELWIEITKMNEGQASLNDLQNALKNAMRNGDILQKKEELTKQEQDKLKTPGKEILTTKEMQGVEKAMLSQIKGKSDSIMTTQQFDQFLSKYQEKMQAERGYSLNSEQISAARMILTGEDRHQAVQGLAGTGKTTMLEFVRQAAESVGTRVLGVSTGGNQAQKLEQESGIKAATLASFLQTKDTPKAPEKATTELPKATAASQPPSTPPKAGLTGVSKATTAKPLDRVNAQRNAQRAEKPSDADLAKRALDTYKRDSNKLLFNMNQAKFKALKDSVDTKKIFDSTGRAYYEDKKGRLFTEGLYNRIGTPGISHEKKGLLTNTKYFKGERGVIFKQKTSRFSPRESIKKNLHGRAEARFQKELDARRRTDTRDPRMGDRASMLLHKMDRAVSKGLVKDLDKLTGGGKWEKVSGWESVFVRVKMWAQTVKERRATLAELREKANSGQAQAAPTAAKSATPETQSAHQFLPPAERPSNGKSAEKATEKATQGTQDTQKVLVIHDEAGQAGSRDMLNFLQKVQEMGGKSVSLGDKYQFQSVAAGRAFEQMQAGGIQSAELKDIRRQETQNLKDTVQMVLAGKQGEALKSLPTLESRDAQDVVYRDAAQAGVDIAKMSKEERGKWEPILKAAVSEDNQATIKTLATDYTKRDEKAQQNTLVLTSTNQSRREINAEIHNQRIQSGQIEKGQAVDILVRIDRTEAQATRASSYEQGEMLRHGNQMYEVAGRDTVTNTLLLKKDGSDQVTRVKAETLGKAQGFTRETREFSVGDKVTFYANDKESGIRNGQSGVIKSIENGKMTVKIGNNVEKTIDLSKFKNLDYGYATTHYRAQGESVKSVMIHHDIRDGAKGNRSNYVSITRAKENATVYTNNISHAARQVEELQDKRQALDSAMGLRKENGITLALDREAASGGHVTTQAKDVLISPDAPKETMYKGDVSASDIFSGKESKTEEKAEAKEIKSDKKADKSDKAGKSETKADKSEEKAAEHESKWDFER